MCCSMPGGVIDTDKARHVVASWREYINTHKDEITALQVMYDHGGSGKVTYAELRELAEQIRRPPYNWTPDIIWNAYLAIDVETNQGKVVKSDRHTATDLVALIRYTLGVDDVLQPYADSVASRYANWLAQQEQAGVLFTHRQRWWLDRIADTIAQAARMSVDDLDVAPPFTERGRCRRRFR